MLPSLTEDYGNPASRSHPFGWRAEEAVEQARGRVARLLGASPREILFTSGATEANNLAIKGAARFLAGRGRHVLTVSTEHPSVLDACRALGREGFEVQALPVDETGRLRLEELRRALREDTILVSVMLANNEIGTLQPIAEVGRLCQEQGITLHCDAVQAAGKLTIDVEELGVDLLSLSAHKVYGPKGVGALYTRRQGRRVRLIPLVDGGGQERGLRSGTLNVPGIVGLGMACELAALEMPRESERVGSMRNRLQERLVSALDRMLINGHPAERLPGNLNVSFEGVDGTALLTGLPGLAVSSGSACHSSALTPSPVLRALGRSDAQAQASLRFGIGRFNTPEEIETAADQVIELVRRLQAQDGKGLRHVDDDD